MIIIQAIVFIVYISFIVYRYGVLPSISESWYVLPKGQKFLFTLFTFGIGVPMLFYDSAVLFLAGSALTFVGAATEFKSTEWIKDEVHYTGAALGIILPLLYFGFNNGLWIPLIAQVVGTIIITLTKTPNKIWWTEILAFVCVLFGLLNF
jgi:hypothetical protein